MGERNWFPKFCERDGCGHPIQMRRTVNGKWMPVDPEPDPEGNVQVMDDGTVKVLGGENLERAHAQHVPLRRAHFDTCGGTDASDPSPH